LRARAKKLRWEEEVTLVPEEMHWTVNFFEKKADDWKAIAESSARPGQRCYAERQVSMWAGLAFQATTSFNECRIKYSPRV
jgi:hypothetical protein